MQPDETTADTRITDDTNKLPTGEIALITKTDLQSRVPATLHDGSIQLNTSTPADSSATAPQPVPSPTYDNTMYIAYMIQWWVFALVMPVTWFLLIRREADDLRAARADAAAAAAGPPEVEPEQVPVAVSASASAPATAAASSAPVAEPVE